MQIASKDRYLDVVDVLLSYGANINASDKVIYAIHAIFRRINQQTNEITHKSQSHADSYQAGQLLH